jgi:hypothetical protein
MYRFHIYTMEDAERKRNGPKRRMKTEKGTKEDTFALEGQRNNSRDGQYRGLVSKSEPFEYKE